MKKYLIIGLFLILLFPLISADVIIQKIDGTSGIILNESLDVELKSAIVIINIDDYYNGRLDAIFSIYSNEEKEENVFLYLKAKGKECYSGCEDIEIVNPLEVDFEINGEKYEPKIYETKDGKFLGINFSLQPKILTRVVIEQRIITLPFEYYLDSLSTFKKADYEKIIINGKNIEAKFNENYPLREVRLNENFIWEYENINTKDPSLKDVLVISKKEENSKRNLIYWVLGIETILIIILLIFLIKKRKPKNPNPNL